VTRCIARALDEEIECGRLERSDRVLLLDATPPPAPRRGEQALAHGSKPRFAWQLWRELRRHCHDLVLVDHLGLARVFRLPAPGFPPRYAIFVHGAELVAAGAGSRRWGLRRARLVLTNSRFTADGVRRLLPELEGRLRVVPLCVDPGKLAVWEALKTAEPAAAAREPATLIVGRLWSAERGKGHDALVEAWPEVVRRCPGAELWIAGSGDDLERVRAKAASAGVADRVRFLGHVSDEELGRLYRRASVYAMPSRQEGFGLVYAEAMWHGTPCIGSTADAAGEVIRNGETGTLVPYADPSALASALIDLLADPDRRRKLGDAARAHARENFTYPRFRRDLLGALGLQA
jgi:phosphatidylinositol alpha-1,6-mannosyltransferase